jgi:hypothetical protein
MVAGKELVWSLNAEWKSAKSSSDFAVVASVSIAE